MSELYGMNEAISQINNRGEFVRNYNQGVNDFNQNLMANYDRDKAGENTADDLTYSKDVINNVMTAGGMKGAWDNRKYEINKAKNTAANFAKGNEVKQMASGEQDIGDVGGVEDAQGSSRLAKLNALVSPDITATATDTPVSILKPNPVVNQVEETVEGPQPKPIETPEVVSGKPNDADAPIKTAAEEEANGEGHGIISHAINKVSRGAIGLDAGETASKFGGAVVSAGMGGVNLVGDIENMAKNKGDPFKKGASWEDDVNNVGQIAQGVSDVVGVIPGLEWVAGLGNIVGGISNVIGLFGDHKKNEQRDANIEKQKDALKSTIAAPSSQGEITATASPSLAKQGLQATTDATF